MFELHNPVNHQGIDLAAANVSRAKVGDAFIDDEGAAGGVEAIEIFFRIDK